MTPLIANWIYFWICTVTQLDCLFLLTVVLVVSLMVRFSILEDHSTSKTPTISSMSVQQATLINTIKGERDHNEVVHKLET